MGLPKSWRKWQSSFFDRRLPIQSQVSFNQRNILIFPTAKGGLFLVASFLIFIAGTNYQNSLLVIFSMFMIGLMLGSVGFTYANLSAISIRCMGADPAYAGQVVVFRFLLSVEKNRRNKLRPRIQIASLDGYSFDTQNVDGHATLSVPLVSRYRGWFKVPRVRIQTTFPMGLIRAWSFPLVHGGSWIYPTPIEPHDLPEGSGLSDEGVHPSKEHGDEWDSLSVYRPGDHMSHIHWKSLAQGRELHTKQFARPAAATLWLDWEDYPNVPTELRLSWLCHRVRTLSASDQPYGLRFPNFERSPDVTSSHRSHCLLALAQFGRPPVETHFSSKPFDHEQEDAA